MIEAAALNELNDALQFIEIKPGSVRAANVHHHAGTLREVHPVHHFTALRAAPIAHGFETSRRLNWVCAA